MEEKNTDQTVQEKQTNELFPIFLKLDGIRLLIIGGGNIALEKLQAIVNNAPETKINLVATSITEAVKQLAAGKENIQLLERPYINKDIQESDIIIAAVNDLTTAQQIQKEAKANNKLINVADKPELCDFYLASIVKKGNLKIAISTNGKSPTVAKRLKETFTELLPDEIDEVLTNMESIRTYLKGDFEHKVKMLNQVTSDFVKKPEALLQLNENGPTEIVESSKVAASAQRNANWYLIGFGVVLFILASIYGLYEFGLADDVFALLSKDHYLFYWMLLVGFLAEIIAGSMGMGYGVICTTILLMLNVPPPLVSASIHSAESFTTAAGSLSHLKLGNVNKKLTKALAIPAIIGAVIGALSLTYVGERYAKITKPFIAAYTMYLGIRIIMNAVKHTKRKKTAHKTNTLALGLIGGFIDSFGGGGWGPLVTGTLIKNGRTPRYVVGSSTVAKFILTVTSAITFIFTLGIQHWNIVAGLLIGGIITAPFSAMLTAKLPTRRMFILVGIVVIIMSLITIYRAIFL